MLAWVNNFPFHETYKIVETDIPLLSHGIAFNIYFFLYISLQSIYSEAVYKEVQPCGISLAFSLFPEYLVQWCRLMVVPGCKNDGSLRFLSPAAADHFPRIPSPAG